MLVIGRRFWSNELHVRQICREVTKLPQVTSIIANALKRISSMTTSWPILVELYTLTLRQGSIDAGEAAACTGLDISEVRRHLDSLQELQLLTSSGDRLIPSDPAIAEMLVTAPIERSIRQQEEELAETRRRLRDLSPIYREHQGWRYESAVVVSIDSAEEVQNELTLLTRDCTQEILYMQPGGRRDPAPLNLVLDKSIGMLDRNVAMRVIYQHTARTSLATRSYIEQIVARGALVRTIIDSFERLLILDRKTAIISKYDSDMQTSGASFVTETSIIDFLCRTFEHHWSTGLDFQLDADRTDVTDELERRILQLMAKGIKDDGIAKRLGISTRTCRRYIKEIMEKLNSSSRFQAGYLAAKLGLYN